MMKKTISLFVCLTVLAPVIIAFMMSMIFHIVIVAAEFLDDRCRAAMDHLWEIIKKHIDNI